MTRKKITQKTAKSAAATSTKSKGFTGEERAAMKERARELKAEAGWKKDKAEGERAALAAIAAMPERPRTPRTARSSSSSKARTSSAPGTRRSASTTRRTSTKDPMWPVAFALKELTAAEEARISTLVKKAVS
jgi:hypothetical protein